jgi:tRNA (guanine-N(7)-)-methyltransferase subunit TRM82
MNYPATHEIESLCLGHKEFVSSLALISDKILLSSSGDKTIRAWTFLNGKQTSLFNLTTTPVQIKTISSSNANVGYLCVLTSEFNVEIYEYEIMDSEALKFSKIGEKKYADDVDLIAGDNFYIKYANGENSARDIFIDRIDISDQKALFSTVFSNVLKILNLHENLSAKIFKSFDLSLLYKKKFDNVKQYIDRKKARIEERKK